MKLPFNFSSNPSEADAQRIRELKGLTLFKKLTARELRELEELLHERSYQKDEVIFDEGDAGLGLFIVVTGRVKVCSSHAALKHLAPEFPGDFRRNGVVRRSGADRSRSRYRADADSGSIPKGILLIDGTG
jgi:hypothetical protein